MPDGNTPAQRATLPEILNNVERLMNVADYGEALGQLELAKNIAAEIDHYDNYEDWLHYDGTGVDIDGIEAVLGDCCKRLWASQAALDTVSEALKHRFGSDWPADVPCYPELLREASANIAQGVEPIMCFADLCHTAIDRQTQAAEEARRYRRSTEEVQS